jgi:hypothetical protein
MNPRLNGTALLHYGDIDNKLGGFQEDLKSSFFGVIICLVLSCSPSLFDVRALTHIIYFVGIDFCY